MNSDLKTNIVEKILSAVKICMSKYFVAKGRASKQEFWYFYLFTFVVSFLFGAFRTSVSGGGDLSGIVGMVFFLPSIMAMIRRLHDLDKPGTTAFLLLIPVVGFIIVLIMCAQDGTKGDNQFGSEPTDFNGGGNGRDDGSDAFREADYNPNAEQDVPPTMDFNYRDIDYNAADEAVSEHSKSAAAAQKSNGSQPVANDVPSSFDEGDGAKRDRYGRQVKDVDSDDKSKGKSDFLEG